MKRISTLVGFIIIAVAIVVFFGGVFVYQYFFVKSQQNSDFFGSSQKTYQTQNQTQTSGSFVQNQQTVAGEGTYINNKYGFEVQYPETIRITDNTNTSNTVFFNPINTKDANYLMFKIETADYIKKMYDNNSYYVPSCSDVNFTNGYENVDINGASFNKGNVAVGRYNALRYCTENSRGDQYSFSLIAINDDFSTNDLFAFNKIVSTFKFSQAFENERLSPKQLYMQMMKDMEASKNIVDLYNTMKLYTGDDNIAIDESIKTLASASEQQVQTSFDFLKNYYSPDSITDIEEKQIDDLNIQITITGYNFTTENGIENFSRTQDFVKNKGNWRPYTFAYLPLDGTLTSIISYLQ